MPVISAYSLVQPALVLEDIDAGVDRMHDLLLAVPSERNNDPEFVNAVYAFGNNTYLELLNGPHDAHTRTRFLRQFGAGMYMFCVDLTGTAPAEIEAALDRAGVRVVAKGRQTANIPAGWHLHPRDAGGLLVLLALKRDPSDNTDWAGHKCQAYVPGNSRIVDELRGVLARTLAPAEEQGRYGEIGFAMAPLGQDGAWQWRGPTGTLFELWPPAAWRGEDVTARRDYALCLAANDPEAAIRRLKAFGLDGERENRTGRWLSSVDPVLGVRFAIEAR